VVDTKIISGGNFNGRKMQMDQKKGTRYMRKGPAVSTVRKKKVVKFLGQNIAEKQI